MNSSLSNRVCRNIVPIRLCRAPVVTLVYVRGVTCACPILVTLSDSQPSFPMFAVLALLVSSIWYTPMELCDDTHSIIELSNSSSVENGNFGYDKSEFSVFDNLDNYNNFHDINLQWSFSNFARTMFEPTTFCAQTNACRKFGVNLRKFGGN